MRPDVRCTFAQVKAGFAPRGRMWPGGRVTAESVLSGNTLGGSNPPPSAEPRPEHRPVMVLWIR